MSDMRPGPGGPLPGGPPPSEPPVGGPPPMMEQLRSPMNPTDSAVMRKRGGQGDTFGQRMEIQFGVKWDDPVEVAGQKILQKKKMGEMGAKTAALGGAPPQGPPGGGPGAPPMGPSPGGNSIQDIMSQIGG